MCIAYGAVLVPMSTRADVEPIRQRAQNVRVQLTAADGSATFLEASDAGFIPVEASPTGVQATPLDFLRQYGPLMGVTDADTQLVQTRRFSCTLGQTHTRFEQVHEGVPVFSGMITVHQDVAGRFIAANGDFHIIKERVDTRPSLTPQEAVAVAAGYLDWPALTTARRELVIVDPGWYGDPPAGAHLAYHLQLDTPDGRAREAFFVDAHTGEVIDQWSDLPGAMYREIYDGEGLTDLPGTLLRQEGEPPAGPDAHADINRAYDYAGDFYGFLARAFDRDGIDDVGHPIRITVNSTYGGCPNARWDDVSGSAIFCEGLLTDDVVAHELTHGLIDYTGRLIYQNQPGQINESFADVFGELVDMFNGNTAFLQDTSGLTWPAHPTGPGEDVPNEPRQGCIERAETLDNVRWLVGEEVTGLRSPLRDMWAPDCYGHPDTANSNLQRCSGIDNGGVHSGSGVPNHAFAMLTDGAEFNGFTIRGIGPIKSGAVWYRALNLYLTVASDYQDAYVALNRAAGDLVSTFPNDPRTGLPGDDAFTEDDALQVDLALRAVEMNTPGLCGRTVPILAENGPPPCPNRRVVYRNDFEHDADGWTVETTSLAKPATPYDWVLETDLPFERAGRAWFCSDPNIGDCELQDEASTHVLTSPPITLPLGDGVNVLAFTHYLETEPAWDGGRVRLRVNGGRWVQLPSTAFIFNPYNGVLRPPAYGSTDPIAGREAWTGVGGRWGTSRIDLSGFAGGSDTIEVQFEFGKDGCTGLTGWYVDDVEVYQCWDCDGNGVPDDRELRFTHSSPVLNDIGYRHDLTYTLPHPPAAGGDVSIRAVGMGDFGSVDEYVTLELNGEIIGYPFAVGAQDCATIPDVQDFTLSAEEFNQLTNGGDAVFRMLASERIDVHVCFHSSYIRLLVDYATTEPDEDGNGVLDRCERCAPGAPSLPAGAVATNRYLPVQPPAVQDAVALRVVPVRLPAPFEGYEGAAYWVGPPHRTAPTAGEDIGRLVAALDCAPHYGTWDDTERIDVYGPAIVPGGVYRVAAVAALPDSIDCSVYSIASEIPPDVVVETARWGDVAGPIAMVGTDRTTDFRDIAAAIAAFVQPMSTEDILRADVYPNVVDQRVDMRDIMMIMTAATGGGYPFDGPTDCR